MTPRPKRANGQTALVIEPDASLREALRERMLSLNFHGYCRLIALLLEKMGYEEVRLSGRRDWKGRNGHDGNTGFDLTAYAPGGLSRRKVIIQVKQFDYSQIIFQRTIDELRGTCLRVGASEALLLTTSSFSPSVQKLRNVLYESPVAPVRLMDGERLLDEILKYQVGVIPSEGSEVSKASNYRIDEAFFESLRHYDGNGRLDCIAPGEPRFLVTVSVQPLKRANLQAAKSSAR